MDRQYAYRFTKSEISLIIEERNTNNKLNCHVFNGEVLRLWNVFLDDLAVKRTK